MANGCVTGSRGIRAALIGAALWMASAPAAAQVVDTRLWGTNGEVNAVLRSGTTLYIGGRFGAVGPCTGGGIPLDRWSGAPIRPFAPVVGRVCAVVPDGRGGWYIGGQFSAVAGVPRSHLAHVLADGSVSPWNPGVSGAQRYSYEPEKSIRKAGVEALALAGDVLYVGGLFTTVGGQERSNLAAVDVGTGAPIEWDPGADSEVRCLALKAGTLYAGGDFDTIGGSARRALAALDARSGMATAWNPVPRTATWSRARVRALAVEGHTVFAGGDFDSIGGAPRNSIAALDARTGRATSWDARLGPTRKYYGMWDWPYVAAVAVQGRTVFVGGDFESAHGESRPNLVALDADSGLLTGFTPAPDGRQVNALAVHGNTVYAGGDFGEAGGQARPGIAALDARTGAATPWNPRADGIVDALASEGSRVFAGGRFTSMYDWQPRSGLASLDLLTGVVTPWNPTVGGYNIIALARIDETLYIMGQFQSLDGLPRGNLAAIDTRTGAVTPWDPGNFPLGSPVIGGLATQGRTVYVAGYFDHLGGQPRGGFAALDATTAAVTSWDPRSNGNIGRVVLPFGDVVYLGGYFGSVGGASRLLMGAVDAHTGMATPWDPRAEGPMVLRALAATDSVVYVAGEFKRMGGEARSDLAAVDATTGSARPWNPRVGCEGCYVGTGHVRAVATSGNTVWAGGEFGTVGGRPHPYLAALDATTALATGWEPHPDGPVSAIAVSGDTLCIGGSFRSIDGLPRSTVAVVLPTRPEPLRAPRAAVPAASKGAPVLTLGPCRPNPARASASLGFSLPAAARVDLAIFDLQGRRVATVLDRAWMDSGSHEVRVGVAGWNAGVYFCRLEAEGTTRIQRLLVLD